MKRYERKFSESPEVEGLKILKNLGYLFKVSDIKKALKLSSAEQHIDNLHTTSPKDPDKRRTVYTLIGFIKAVKDGRDPDKGGFGVVNSVVKDLEKRDISVDDLNILGNLFRQNIK